jgi:hypothetical protein
LSKEARELLGIRQKKARNAYQEDLNKAWDLIDKQCASIAETHGKSLRRVQFALHTGQRQLTRQVRNTSSWNAYLWKTNQLQRETSVCVPALIGSKADMTPGNVQGKAVLGELVNKNNQKAYQELTAEQLDEMVREFDMEKATEAKAKHQSNKARISDVTFTVKAVENEVSRKHIHTHSNDI